MSSSTYRVTGMTCEHCVAAVTEELTALDGVTAVSIDLVAGGTSDVTVESSAPLDTAAVAEAVDEAGYALAGPRDLPLA
ncbi:heavy-metal-associated domain-containing protein [Aeromicrobium wangtongii]|uniref:Heavy-metal-associated domain-containing protein n=1 Tax=Aeromicrobium wangtongii TaxID=2969247 RepID=A0ABY5M690_9ACTN|nr:heavy-metal-associated domain-containing protein [Aeromicrobium wangtongii]MCD9199324.1 heavy-metal-associated domain-containing protein [Aeromicrobium wangtongii]UUP13685.1 heavy-metal-associated domain-containing protein [Aeromicrobium wangtongii]